MTVKLKIGLLCLLSLAGCASVPEESVTLSETLGRDLLELEQSHLQLVSLHYQGLEDKVNTFVDDTYAPFVINFVLKDELELFHSGEPSLYATLTAAAESAAKEPTSEALSEMADFVEAAREQIESKRAELLLPILQQEQEVTAAIRRAYANTLYANTALTAHLRSIRKVKEAQGQALSVIGLEGADVKITEHLVRASDEISTLLRKAKEIDAKSDDAYKKLEEISDKIKHTIDKKD
jgi:hypothetical protein